MTPRNLKAMVLLTDALGGYGGIAKFNQDLLEALSADGRFERIIALPRLRPARDHQDPPPIVEYRIPVRESRWRYGLSVVLQSLRNRPVSLLLCGHINLLPVALAGARLSRARLGLVVHGIDAWQAPTPRFIGWMKSVDMVLSVSQFTAEQLVSWSGLDPQRCRVLPNSIDLQRFSAGEAPAELVHRLGLQGRKVLLTVGRLDQRERTKGFDETIEVLAKLKKQIPELIYLIVGDGDDRSRLQAKAAELGVADRVIFAGYVPESEKTAYYRVADVYVMPSRSEGFGIVYLEALACGLPVIGGLHGGGTEVLSRMERALAIPPTDTHALEAAILEMLRLGRGAAPRNLADYSDDRFKQRLKRYIDQLLEE